MHQRFALVAAGFICSSGLPTAAQVNGQISGSARVIDGDTIAIGETKIRMEGIDAPETQQECLDARGRDWACGRTAKFRLERLLAAKQVRCAGNAKDDYGRLIATCFVGDVDINAQMVRDGMAWAFVKYISTYVGQETKARASKRGVFVVVNQPPWEYRAAQRNGTERTAQADKSRQCPIKGNVSSKGQRSFMCQDSAITPASSSTSEKASGGSATNRRHGSPVGAKRLADRTAAVNRVRPPSPPPVKPFCLLHVADRCQRHAPDSAHHALAAKLWWKGHLL